MHCARSSLYRNATWPAVQSTLSNVPHPCDLLSVQVSLRAIPVRCLALDSMVQAFAKTLPKAEADAHTARVEEGRTAANKLNKLYWYLQPQVPLTGIDGMGGPCPAPGMPGAGPMMSQLGQQQPLPQHTQGLPHMRSRVRSASYGGPGAAPPSQMQQQQQQACQMQRGGFNSMGGGPMGVMGMGGGPGAPGMGPMGGAPPRPPMAQQLHANQLGALQHQQHQQQQQLNAALAAAQAQQQQQQQLQSLMGAGDAMQQALLAADYSSAGLPPMHPGSSLQAQLQLQAQLLQQLYLN